MIVKAAVVAALGSSSLAPMAGRAQVAAPRLEAQAARWSAAMDGASFAAAAAPAELVHAPAPSLFDKTAFASALKDGRLAYGVELESPNPTTAATLARNRAIGTLVVDAESAERGRLAALAKAVSHVQTAIVGVFRSVQGALLKPKLDEGLLGALLENPGGLKDTLRFLRRVYVPPQGERGVGPSEVSGHLSRSAEFIAKNNAAFVGGVVIGDARSAGRIESIVKAAPRGLKLVQLDSRALALSLGVPEGAPAHAALVARVEDAARGAGVALGGRAETREQALALRARGYRHVIVGSEREAAAGAFADYEDVARDARVEPAPGSGTLREWVARRKLLSVGMITTPDLGLARAMASRAHGIWVDGEHGQFPLARARELIRALSRETPVVARVSRHDAPEIEAYIAAGASAIVAPSVSTPAQARAFVARVKRADPRALAIPMIENEKGLSRVEEIAAVPGVDLLFVGPNDLGLSMGAAPESPAFKAALARIESAARAAGLPVGGLAKSRSTAQAMHAKGYSLLIAVVDQNGVEQRFAKTLAGAIPKS